MSAPAHEYHKPEARRLHRFGSCGWGRIAPQLRTCASAKRTVVNLACRAFSTTGQLHAQGQPVKSSGCVCDVYERFTKVSALEHADESGRRLRKPVGDVLAVANLSAGDG